MWKLRLNKDALFNLLYITLVSAVLIISGVTFLTSWYDYKEDAVTSNKEEVVENWSQLESIIETELNLGKRVTIIMQPGGYKQIEVTTPIKN